MKAVLISIRPKWCELIAIGRKTLELRKSVPKIQPPFKCYIYQTKKNWLYRILNRLSSFDWVQTVINGQTKVIGEFTCDWIMRFCQMANADMAERQSCVRREDIFEYSNGKEVFGWHISNLEIYDTPKRLDDFIVKSDIGCCNEGKCRNCVFFDKGNGFSVEDDCTASFDTDEYKPLRKAPQSWCYVEEAD